MKKIVVFFSIIILALTSLVGCSEFKDGIEKARGTKIKKLSVQSCQIKEDFWAYTKDGIETLNAIEGLTEDIKKNNDEIDDLGFEVRLLEIKSWSMSSAEFNKTKSELKEQVEAVKNKLSIYKDSLDFLSGHMESLAKEKQTGTLYVARFVEKNEFGKWNGRNTYMVFTIEPNGEYTNYSEHEPLESLKFVYRAFPEVAEQARKLRNF